MNWRNLPHHDYFLYARSYHSAAKKLARMLDLEPGPIPNYDLCPVLSAYRHAVELHLKVIVLGEGGNFLETKPDKLTVHKTKIRFLVGAVRGPDREEPEMGERVQD